MKKSIRNRTYFWIIGAAFFAVSCGSGDGGPTNPGVDITELLQEGWSFFQSSPPNYSSAISSFTEGISMNSNVPEAFVGRGWSFAGRAVGKDDADYTSAIRDFDSAIALDIDELDAYAGRAFVNLVKDDYAAVVADAEIVLTGEPNYVFSRDTDIGWRDLQLVRGQAYFSLGDFDQVVNVLDILLPSMEHPADQPAILLQRLQSLTEGS